MANGINYIYDNWTIPKTYHWEPECNRYNINEKEVSTSYTWFLLSRNNHSDRVFVI